MNTILKFDTPPDECWTVTSRNPERGRGKPQNIIGGIENGNQET